MSSLAGIDGWPVAHAAAAVIGPDGILETRGDQSTPFALASVTKPLTALAVLLAIEEEALQLDDALPAELAAMLPGATVEHLLAHASGIGPEQRRFTAEPGTRRIYSNAGFDVLGELVEAATGIEFGDYIAEAVFAPLAMTGASLIGSPAKDGRAGVADLAAVVAEFLTPSGLLHESTLASMTSVHFPGLRGVLPGYGQQLHNDWGLGVEIRSDKAPHWTSDRNSPATFGHFGRSGTMFWVDPQARIGLVALADRDFDEWAIRAWPALSTAVLEAHAG